MLWIIAGVAVIGAAAWGPIVSNVEQAKYEVVESQGNIQIRDYAPMIVAEAKVSGERKEAINEGFRIIADYIFGNNAPKQNVAMTAPVIQQPAEKIAMTAPVIQQGDGNQWKVRFVMPAGYTMDTLPKPNNEAVTLKEIGGKRFAVIRFSGMAGEDSLKEQTNMLNTFITKKNLKVISQPTYAFFNPPWTLPFLRRNEVMVEVVK
ncbi:MAG: heme-binding protein [Rickettsiales bacterium]|nr:heme-binding protein [Rickettsiales bacterium]